MSSGTQFKSPFSGRAVLFQRQYPEEFMDILSSLTMRKFGASSVITGVVCDTLKLTQANNQWLLPDKNALLEALKREDVAVGEFRTAIDSACRDARRKSTSSRKKRLISEAKARNLPAAYIEAKGRYIENCVARTAYAIFRDTATGDEEDVIRLQLNGNIDVPNIAKLLGMSERTVVRLRKSAKIKLEQACIEAMGL